MDDASDPQDIAEQTDEDEIGDDDDVRTDFPAETPMIVDELIANPGEVPDSVATRSLREEPDVLPEPSP